jgi:hypothetical protein
MKQIHKDLLIGVIGGLIGFFVIVMPILKFMDYFTITLLPKIETLYNAYIYDVYNKGE